MIKIAYVHTEMPEHPEFSFITSGPMGGDAGHGADATLKIVLPSTGALVELSGPETRFEQHQTMGSTLSITVCGDWEIDGLEEGLIDLGRQLSGEYTYLRLSMSRDEWGMLVALSDEAGVDEEDFAKKLLLAKLQEEAREAQG